MAAPRNTMVIKATRPGVVDTGIRAANEPPLLSKEDRIIRRVVAEHRRGTSPHSIAADLTADTEYTTVAEVRAIIAEHAPKPAERKPPRPAGQPIDTELLVEMYQRGDPIAAIRAELNIGRRTVHRLLRAAGVQPSRVNGHGNKP
ncbi:hypothetical protein [Amycolatopsis sp. A1MSW2902]|uniref:hypothetical protein n=1 Tax=Amycolatopsis sp. A1MSW2902 TaxID=687413 RepID=UPI00307D8974